MQNVESVQEKKVMLSIGEASEYLGVSIDTLRRWEKKGRVIAPRSPGGHRYFRKKDLDKLFDVKYTRDSKPKPYIRKAKDDKKKNQYKVTVEEKKVQAYTEVGVARILDRPVREIKIPPIKPVTIRTGQEEASMKAQYRVSVVETPLQPFPPKQQPQQTPNQVPTAPQQVKEVQPSLPAQQTTTHQVGSSIPTKSILETPTPTPTPQQQTIKEESKNKRSVIITIISIFLIVTILFFYWYSRPRILSPVP